MRKVIYELSDQWGVNNKLVEKSVNAYTVTKPDVVPFIDEIVQSVDFTKAANQEAGILSHNMNLIKELPRSIAKVKEKYE